jgi:hypothetical protein
MVMSDAKPTTESNSEFDLNLTLNTAGNADKPQSSKDTQQSIQASLAKLKAFLKR